MALVYTFEGMMMEAHLPVADGLLQLLSERFDLSKTRGQLGILHAEPANGQPFLFDHEAWSERSSEKFQPCAVSRRE